MIAPLAALLLASSWAGEPQIRQPQDIEWKVSGTMPQGLATHDYHLIYEDPATHGILTFVRFSKGYVLAAHSHSHDESIIILKGKLEISFGGKTSTLGPGGYAVVAAGTAHALKTSGWSGCEFVASFSGPIDFKSAPN